VSVACSGTLGLPTQGLHTALSARTPGANITWDVRPTTQFPDVCAPVIALCDAASVAAMTGRWPDCAVVAVVAAHDDGNAVIAALQAGAATCIRGENLAIAAAFIVAVARRGGLIPADEHS
jgi:DNA-binding NarL/FixJ family response regulator